MTFRKTGVYRRTNEQWLNDLRGANGLEAQGSAYEDLGRYVWACAYKVVSTLSPEKYPAIAGLSDEILRDYTRDFMQMTLEKIAEGNGTRLDQFRGEAPFTAWIAQVTNNIVFSEIRKARYRKESILPPAEGDEEFSDNDPLDIVAATADLLFGDLPDNPESSFEDRQAADERKRALARCLEERSERERIAIWAQVVEGSSGQEIADRLEISRNAFYQLVRDARHKLLDCLKRRGIR